MERPPPKPGALVPAPAATDEDSLPARRRGEVMHPDDASGQVWSIMGGSTRKGEWEPPAQLHVTAIMGGVQLDFREAALLDETVVEVFALMGGVEIIVPPDVDVECSGTGFLGEFSGVCHRAEEEDVPLIRVEGLALMGGVDVKVKKLSLKKRLLNG